MRKLCRKIKRNPTVTLIGVGAFFCTTIATVVGLHYFCGIDLPFLKLQNYQSASYWGQLGDFVGGMLNPILSFLALVAVALSISSQKAESLKALRESKRAVLNQVKQTRISHRQSFESVFFNLLNLKSNAVGNVRCFSQDGEFKEGIEAFEEIKASFPLQELKEAFIPGGRGNADRMAGIRNNFANKYNQSLRHYLEIIEQIILYVDDYPSDVVPDKMRYFSILRAMLSQPELDVLQHYVGTSVGKGLVEATQRAELFKNK